MTKPEHCDQSILSNAPIDLMPLCYMGEASYGKGATNGELHAPSYF